MEAAVPNDQITIDELLERQGQPGQMLVTIEALPDDDERVKVTPFVAEVGCLCSRALNVNKSAIESVTTTDEVHVCCGKRLMVVEVVFADATLADIFQQVADAVQQAAPGRTAPPALTAMSRMLPPGPAFTPYLPPFNAYANWAPYPFRAVPPMRSRFATPLALSNEALRSYEEGYRGAIPNFPSPSWYDFLCNSARIACEEGCFIQFPDDPDALNICRCECENDYRQCLHPAYHRTPCF
jgi:hypothetical protein